MNKRELKKLGFEKIVLTDDQKDYFTNYRGKMFDVITYLPLNVVKKLCNDIKTEISYYIGIEHNKIDDLLDKQTGDLKKEHIHLVIFTCAYCRMSAIAYLFNTTNVLPLSDMSQIIGSIEYLTHTSKKAIAEGKVKYEPSKLFSNDIAYFETLLTKSRKKGTPMEIIDLMILGASYRDLITMFGRDFAYHYKLYNELADIIRVEDGLEYNKIKNKKIELVED